MKATSTKDNGGIGMLPVKSDAPSGEAVDEPCRIVRVGAEEELTSLEEAINSCTGGEEIQLSEGNYELSKVVSVNFNLSLVATGKVVVSCTGSMFIWQGGNGVFKGLHLKQRVCDEEERTHLVEVLSGSVIFDNCELDARGGACVYAHGMQPGELAEFVETPNYTQQGLDEIQQLLDKGVVGLRLPPAATIRGCTLRSKRSDGVVMEFGVTPTVEDCVVTKVAGTGISVMDCNAALIQRNKIQGTRGAGIFLYGSGSEYVVDDNEILETKLCGIEVMRECDPTVKRNRIHHCKAAGIFVRNEAQGTYEGNEIYCNEKANMDVTGASDVVVRGCTIRGGGHVGLLIRGGAKGTFEDNEICANTFPNIEVRAFSSPLLRRNKVHSGRHFGLLARFDGMGDFIENEFYNNTLAAVHVHKRSIITLRGNHIHHGLGKGIFVEGDSLAELVDNRIHDNAVVVPIFEPAKRLKQNWVQWFKKKSWNLLEAVVWDAGDDPEDYYPTGYEEYTKADYAGDFDGFEGDVIYDAEEGTDEAPTDRVLEDKYISEGPTVLFAAQRQYSEELEAEKREKAQGPIG